MRAKASNREAAVKLYFFIERSADNERIDLRPLISRRASGGLVFVAQTKSLTSKEAKTALALLGSTYLSESWKIVAEKLDVFDGTHLITLLEAAHERGRQVGSSEMSAQLQKLGKQLGKQIQVIEAVTGTKTRKKRRKRKLR